MEYRALGRTGLVVSRLCFGALTIGPLHANLSLSAGAGIIRRALEGGVNFIDTAESYDTYAYIRAALEGWDRPVVLATKSYAYTAAGMARSLEVARRELGRDVIEVFLLHEMESEHTLRGHREALEYLLAARARGLVRAVGISTHTVAGVRAAAREPEIDVIHPLFNCAGVGIRDGTADDMLSAIREAHGVGKGIYAMKALAGGHLIPRAEEALRYVLARPEIASVAVGMQSVAEVEFNLAIAGGRSVDPELRARLAEQRRRLHVEDWCQGCGQCVERCPHGALSLVGGRAAVDPGRCLLCGYCASACGHFCLKVV